MKDKNKDIPPAHSPDPVSHAEILHAAILLREEDPNWSREISVRVGARMRARFRRNFAAVAALVLTLGIGTLVGVQSSMNQEEVEGEDPYVALYDSLYVDTSLYPELDTEEE